MKNIIIIRLRYSGIFISAVMLFMLLFVNNAAAAESNVDEARGLIAALTDGQCIFESDSPSQIVTREKFIIDAVKLFGINAHMAQTVEFKDVESDGELYRALCAAVGMKWISASELFRPQAEITLDEALKIACAVTGYAEKAELLGGYPAGYRKAAIEADLLKGLTGGIDENGELILLFNILKTNMLETVTFSQERLEFSSENKTTVLEKLYGIYTTEGIVSANEYTALGNPDAKNEKGRIEIEGERYLLADSSCNVYLGYNVNAYYVQDGSDCTIVYAFPKNNRKKELNAMHTTYIPSQKKLVCDNDITQTVKLSAGYDYIYNGKVSNPTANEIVPENGKISLIDNDNDGTYEVVSVTSCYYMQISRANKLDKTIDDKYDAFKCLNLDVDGCSYNIHGYDGEELGIEDLENDSVLAVYISKDRQLVDITVCEESASGILTAIDKDGHVLTIDSSEYTILPEFEQSLLDMLRLGDTYSFILGLENEIVLVEDITLRYVYGYLSKVAYDNKINKRLQVKVFDDTGMHKVLEFCDKPLLNGKGATQEELYTALYKKGKTVAQLIKYKLGNNGKIKSLDTAETSDKLKLTRQENPDNSLIAYELSNGCNYRQSVFYPHFNVDGATVFRIPADLDDEKSFEVGYSFTDGDYMTVTPYDIDGGGHAGAVVYLAEGEEQFALSTTNKMMIVERVIQARDENEFFSTKVIGWEEGKFSEYFIDSEVKITKNGMPASLCSGDIIRFSTINNVIDFISVDFNAETMTKNGDSSSAPFNKMSSKFQYQAGQVYSTEKGYMYISPVKNGDGSFDFSFSSLINVKIPGRLVVFDFKTNRIHTADESFIKKYTVDGDDASFIVVKQEYMNSEFGFIYLNRKD